MIVLVVCSINRGEISPFILQQIDSLHKLGVEIHYFLIRGKGPFGYLRNISRLKKVVVELHPDLVSAHYGLSGLLAVLQHKVPVITTFHGSDINNPKIRYLSKITMWRSAWSVFVSKKLALIVDATRNYSLIPCGVNLETFQPIEKSIARQRLRLDQDNILILFSESFTNPVKNYSLASSAIDHLNNNYFLSSPVKLLELKNYSIKEVCLLLNACDVALLTSFTEGSPNFIKEAMACNRPIVSTDVGDVQILTKNIPGCFIAKNNPDDLADKIEQALEFDHSIGARQRIIDSGLEINETAKKILRIYEDVLRNNKKGHKL